MAEVLLARSDGIEGFERHVVLKRILPEHARDQRFIQMFLDEARLAASLHHQSIVQVFDIGASNGEYFFAMEYVHGEDLRKLLTAVAKARSYVPLDIVCAIVSAAASALHYAHERRDSRGRPLEIVHRDVSPSNILIGYDGAVKVVDFGIARASVRTSETVAGSLKGKISYMSPEQCRCGPIDRRSDVYGLGVLLYELSTTSRLFKGDSDYLVMDAIVNGKFALPQVRRPDLPNELATIIMRALATDPRRRYQTAEELRFELDELAARNYGIATTATIAAYMKKIFGVRPEPWLDPTLEPDIARSGTSWNESGSDHDAERIGRRTDGSLSLPLPAPAVTSTGHRPAVIETAPTQKFGWEAANRMQAARASKLRWVAAPLVAVAGFATWKLARPSDDALHDGTAASVVASDPVGKAPTTAPPAVQKVDAPTSPVAAAAMPTPSDATRTGNAPIIPPPRERSSRNRKAERDKPETRIAARTTPAPVTAPVEPVAPSPAPAAATPPPSPTPAAPAVTTTATAPTPAAPSADPPTPAPAPPATPKEIDVRMPVLSNATVSAIAANYSRQLAKCESGASLRGEVAVSFEIDSAGKVVKSQLSSTIKNPKVAACILKSVQSWKFPKGRAAKGVYSISYQ